MKTHLLFSACIFLSVGAQSQNLKIKPIGATNRLAKRELISEGMAAKTTGPLKAVNKPMLTAKTSSTSAVSCTPFSGSYNALGVYLNGQECLQYNDDVNGLTFVHRASPSYSTIPNGNSGTIVTKYSVNQGTTWDSTVIWTNTTNFGRYPQGGIWNVAGNTNINNAYFVGMGETTPGSGFNGNWFSSKKVTTPGTTTPGTDMQFFANTAPFGSIGKKFDFARYGFSFTKDSYIRAIGEICNDVNGTTNATFGVRGCAVLKGTFSAGAFTWTYDSLVPSTITRPSDGSKHLVTDQARLVWNDAGTVGYAVMIGVRAGSTLCQKGYQPIVYKTTNSGASWSLMPAGNFNASVVTDRILSINTNTNLIVPFFSTGEGIDAAVDVNDNLHLVCTIVGTSSADNDSLDYTYNFTPNQYSFPYGGSFGYPTIYDVCTLTTGGWRCMLIDSMGTEGPSGTSGQPGYSSNTWAAANMPLTARIQVSHSPDRKKIFYSWAESDTTVTGNNWNIFPDIKMKGYDVTTNKMTGRVNVTSAVSTPNVADQTAYFHYMSNRSIVTNSTTGTNEIPFTISYNGTNDGNQPVSHFYLKGASFNQSDFSLNMSLLGTSGTSCGPLGVNEITAHNIVAADLYPNPANDAVTILLSATQAGKASVSIVSVTGSVVLSTERDCGEGQNEIGISIGGLSPGVYMCKIETGTSVIIRKLIVQ